MDNEEINIHIDEPVLFLHKKRPSWGAAMLAREADGRRSYQFQDGSLRKFKKGFYHLFEPLNESSTVMETLVEDLQQKYDASLDQKRLSARRNQPPVMEFEEQVQVFRALYPHGFQDPGFIEEWRGGGDIRRRKRHTAPASAQAQALLSRERLTRLLKTGQYSKIHTSMVRVLSKTGMVSPSKAVKPLRALDAGYHQRLSHALFDVLYGDGHYIDRLREYILALDADGTIQVRWPMVTALPALVHPTRHVCVRRSAFRLQARSMAPNSHLKKVPTPKGYRRARKMARAVHKRLLAEGLEPRDLLDTRVFIWETLRPKGRALLDELPKTMAA
ncbi:MAG: hypothetical protein AAFV53_22235 [Myxococcota bacterium]